jgi:pilus assembly protein Flp/PilA
MTFSLQKINAAVSSFAKDEDGAQIVEYALIIAVVSLALIGAMGALADTDFDAWITRVGGLLNPAA